MSDRSWTILGTGLGLLGLGLTLWFALDGYKPATGALTAAGVLVTVYGFVQDRIRANKLSLVFSEEPPYTFPDTSKVYQVSYRIGVRGSKRVPRDVKLMVTNIQPTPTEHPYFRADYPYHLRQLSQKDDKEILFQFVDTWISSESDLIVCGIQMDKRDEPEKLRIKDREIWDVALKVVSDDAGSVEGWLRVAAVDKRLKVRRLVGSHSVCKGCSPVLVPLRLCKMHCRKSA
jgi:hypothetical protein